MITREELINKYLQFFRAKKHQVIPSASLIPANDPTVLFTTAGMHPLVPYLLGQKHPLGKRLVSVQKCIRTTDIDEVGDTTHHTFFEMLGNWSLGDYWKEDAIKWSFEFLTKELKLPIEKIAVTCFGGDKRVPELPKDEESYKIWQSVGMSKDRIEFLEGGVFESKKNWWGPAGTTGPCGPDTEMFYWRSSEKVPKKFNADDERWVEIWNDVLMQYEKTTDEKYLKAKQHNVDTGMGVERTLATLNGLEDNYLTDSFLPIIKEIEKISGKKYKGNEKAFRVIADHLRAAVFILSEPNQIKPSNVGQGYTLRRLIRRSVRYWRQLVGQHKASIPISETIAETVIKLYKSSYPEVEENRKYIINHLIEEENKFSKTLEEGLKAFDKIAKSDISGKEAFLLYQSYGFPIELTTELAKERGGKVNLIQYDEEYKKHQEVSGAIIAGTFKSGLADNSQQTTRLHTATHLLNEALRHVLGKDVKQRGSNITAERLRFDFNFPRKLTEEEIKKIESLVNEKIQASLPVTKEEASYEDAIKSGAQAEFGHKYPERVTVYTMGSKNKWFSREICTGPHVNNTHELGTFKIIKEEAVAAGTRRIKAIVTEDKP